MIYIESEDDFRGRLKQRLELVEQSDFLQDWYDSDIDWSFPSLEAAKEHYDYAVQRCDILLNFKNWEENQDVHGHFDFILQYEQQTMGWE